MEESPSVEKPTYTREQVVEALKKLVARGLTNQDDLSDWADPEAIEADMLLDRWTTQEMEKSRQIGTPEADLEYSLSRSTIFVDAGCSDPDYLDEVANDWLAQDLDAAEGYGLTELAKKIQAKIDEIESKLNSPGR